MIKSLLQVNFNNHTTFPTILNRQGVNELLHNDYVIRPSSTKDKSGL